MRKNIWGLEMEEQYKFSESGRSRKRTFFRRLAMLFIFGLLAWSVKGDFVASASGDGGSKKVSYCGERSDCAFSASEFVQLFSNKNGLALEDALLFGQAPCR